MNKKIQIRYLTSFYKDLEKIIKYIRYKLNNTIAARELLKDIEKEIEKRRYNPKSYEKYDSYKKRKDIYYKIHIKSYIIFYIVKDETMEVRRILYGRRDFKKII